MRGVRGGMGTGMMGGMPMGGLPMGGMGGAMAGMAAPMGMGQMGGGMPGKLISKFSYNIISRGHHLILHSAIQLFSEFFLFELAGAHSFGQLHNSLFGANHVSYRPMLIVIKIL